MQEKTTRTQADRRVATQAQLIATARALFAQQGFAGVGAPEIAEKAGVTRGAITHHFKDKTGLFHAVVRAEAVVDMLKEKIPSVESALFIFAPLNGILTIERF